MCSRLALPPLSPEDAPPISPAASSVVVETRTSAKALRKKWCDKRSLPSYSMDAQSGPCQMALSCQYKMPIVFAGAERSRRHTLNAVS